MPKLIFILFLFYTVSSFAQDSLKTLRSGKFSGTIDSSQSGENLLIHTKSDSEIISDVIKPERSLKLKNNSNKLTWHDWLTNIPQDYTRFYDEAIHTDLGVYFWIAASTAGFMATDNRTWLTQHEWYKNSNVVRQLSDRFGEIGDGRTQFTLTGLFVGWGLLFKDERALRTGSQILQVTISAGAFVQVLKHMTGRESPVVSTEPAGEWKLFPSPIAYHKHVPAYDAYPSGHLTTMLGMVVVIAENYPEWKWVKPLGYTVSALMAISMVNNGIHWYSDYPLAIFLGYEFGMIVAHPEKYKSNKDENKISFRFAPYRSYNGTGIAFSLKF